MHTFHYLLRPLSACVNWSCAVAAAVGPVVAVVVRSLVCGLPAPVRTSSLATVRRRLVVDGLSEVTGQTSYRYTFHVIQRRLAAPLCLAAWTSLHCRRPGSMNCSSWPVNRRWMFCCSARRGMMLSRYRYVRRLRADGFTVVERARPRRRNDAVSLSVNHGGVAIVAAAGIRLTAINIGVQPLTFECVAARVASGMSSCIVLIVYRPGSSHVTASFFSCWIVSRHTSNQLCLPVMLISGWSPALIHTHSLSVICWLVTV